jgi:hypothetical protein
VTSGKGGVGKTTSSASFSSGLALLTLYRPDDVSSAVFASGLQLGSVPVKDNAESGVDHGAGDTLIRVEVDDEPTGGDDSTEVLSTGELFGGADDSVPVLSAWDCRVLFPLLFFGVVDLVYREELHRYRH